MSNILLGLVVISMVINKNVWNILSMILQKIIKKNVIVGTMLDI
jgi:TRAP-type C4-dicarboxylate transport system substrate-binding protein